MDIPPPRPTGPKPKIRPTMGAATDSHSSPYSGDASTQKNIAPENEYSQFGKVEAEPTSIGVKTPASLPELNTQPEQDTPFVPGQGGVTGGPSNVEQGYDRPSRRPVSAATVTPLKNSVKWLRIISIAGYVMTAILAIAAFQFFSRSLSAANSMLGMVTLGIAFFYTVKPALKIWTMADIIADLDSGRDEHDLNDFLDSLQNLVKYSSFLILGAIIMYIIYIILTYGNLLIGL